MAETWECGDCHRVWPMTRNNCGHPFDDYLGLREVKTIDEAIAKRIQPYLNEFDRLILKKQRKPIEYLYFTSYGSPIKHRIRVA